MTTTRLQMRWVANAVRDKDVFLDRCHDSALWAFHDAQDFRTAVLKAVNLGEDADTTGVVRGQLAGAYWGGK